MTTGMYQPIPYEAKGLRGLRARIIGEIPFEYDLPQDIKDVVIADDEPNIYPSLPSTSRGNQTGSRRCTSAPLRCRAGISQTEHESGIRYLAAM